MLTVQKQHRESGVYGPFEASPFPSDSAGYRLSYETDSGFPTSPGDVLAILVERSDDGGATWRHDASLTLAPGPWKRRDGTIVTSDSIGVRARKGAGMAAGSTLRVTLTLFRPCNFGCTLGAA